MAPKKDASRSYNNSVGLYYAESSQLEVGSEKATEGNLDTIDEYLTPTSGLRPTHGSHGIPAWLLLWSYNNLISCQPHHRRQSKKCHPVGG